MNRCAPVRRASVLALALLMLAWSRGAAQFQTMSIERLAPGVYGAIYSEMTGNPVQSNALVIIGDSAVCVVDAHYTPRAARATIAEIRNLTRLPVRYVVTTHWHDDHVFGNQAYRAAWPGVTFVAQEHTRESMVAKLQEHRDQLIPAYEKGVVTAGTRARTGLDRDGKPLSAEDKADYARLVPVYRAYAKDFKEVHPVMPDLTFDREIALHLGGRDVRVMSLGAGNTPGDAVIFLPEEKIAAVGDLLVYPVPFIYGGYPASWVRVLKAVRDLGPAIIVPGHGPVMRDFAYLDQVTDLMQALAGEARDAVARGLTVEQARDSIDLSALRARFVAGKAEREGWWESSILNGGIQAAFDEAKGVTQPD